VETLAHRKILLLEDESSIATSIIYSFERELASIVHTQTCGDAYQQLSKTSYDLAIFDIGLPDGSGLELCKTVRTFSQIPIIFLTARDEEIDRILGLEFGGDDYLTKPFSPRELIARSKAILRRTSVKAPQTSTHARSTPSHSLQIDENRCLVTYEDQTIPLTKTEYQLLLTLFKNPQRVYSREQLLYAISEDPGSAMDRVIDAHIKSIRAKIKQAHFGAPDFIQTRRGLGYCFNFHQAP